MKFISKTRAAIAAAPAALLLVGTSAHAALPAGISSSISDAGADLVEAGTLVVTAMVGFWAIRKVGQKLGMW